MIKSYTDHAANERTFLAWLRTGVAVIAFGFLIDRFDLFILTLTDVVSIRPERREELDAMSSSLGHGTGQGFIFVGFAFIIVATVRFVRTGYRLDDPKVYPPGIVTDLSLSVVLAVLLLIVSVPLILQSF
jgi:putative membrane protein